MDEYASVAVRAPLTPVVVYWAAINMSMADDEVVVTDLATFANWPT